jgi:phage terminase large subunit-like protein
MKFRTELKIGDELGVPRTKDEMSLAIESNYIIPAFRDGIITVDKMLDHVDVVLDWYIPSIHAIDFINFIRLVLGEEPENTNPKAHYFLIDCIFRQENVLPYFKVRNIKFTDVDDRILVLCTREFSKSVLIGTMLVLYIASKGVLPGFGKVNYALYVSDSMRNNVKTTMETIGSVYMESEYLRSIFEDATTNQDEISFVRRPKTKKDIALYNEYVNVRKMKPTEVPGRMKRTFTMKGLGAASGGRGSRDSLSRPEIAIFDDMIGNETDANSDTIINNIDSTIESDVLPALSGNGNFAILIGTPYNKFDPVYKRAEDGSWAPIVFPKAENMDKNTTPETFRGVWPDRHSFKQCKKDYMKAYAAQENGNPLPMKKLKQEYYLRISSDEERLIPDNMIHWFSRNDVISNSWDYNWYITTDYTTTGNKGSDFSGAALWAVNSNSQFFLVDLVLRKMEVETQYNETFAMVAQMEGKCRGVEVGVEIDGQQNLHILNLQERMPKKNIFFTFARQKGAKPGSVGIRSRLESGNKHWRFRMMLPYFQNQKIWFPVELKGTPDMNELLDEIKYTTYESFGAKADDGNDIISQLSLIDIIYPSPGMNDMPKYTVGIKPTYENSRIWGRNAMKNYDDEDNAYDSYA